jgi:hypothetical protein
VLCGSGGERRRVTLGEMLVSLQHASKGRIHTRVFRLIFRMSERRCLVTVHACQA